MVKRSSKNIGKEVVIESPGTIYHGRTGRVVGFRGDVEKEVPWVEVFLSSTKSVWPFSGRELKYK